MVCSLVLLMSILCSPNRSKDPLYIIIVVLMLLYGIFETPLNAVFLLNEIQDESYLNWFLFFAFYINFVLHWLFPIQFV